VSVAQSIIKIFILQATDFDSAFVAIIRPYPRRKIQKKKDRIIDRLLFGRDVEGR